MRLVFHGGAGTVTGANYLLESGDTKILVDCGLVQGTYYAEEVNFGPFPYEPKEIDAIFITHAHIDHTGRLPKLVIDGLKGPVYSTEPTKAFSEHLLEDSMNILSKEADRCKKSGFCTPGNIEALIKKWECVPYHKPVTIGPFTVTFYNAGHIIGSAFLLVEVEGKRIVFSGDLGNSPAPLIKPREPMPEDVQYCLIESTYGNRTHGTSERARRELEKVIEDTVAAGGVLLIPAFAMERTQILLFDINRLTEIYERFTDELNDESSAFIQAGKKLFNFPMLKETVTRNESKKIEKTQGSKVIIAGAGMSQGGRIIFHEKTYLPDPNNTILFIGYQTDGSPGREILDGAKSISIFDEEVVVKARIEEISGYSAHADAPQLMDWLSPERISLEEVFVVQGDSDQMKPFSQKIRDRLAIKTTIPSLGEERVL